jgi:hypothetical protein
LAKATISCRNFRRPEAASRGIAKAIHQPASTKSREQG